MLIVTMNGGEHVLPCKPAQQHGFIACLNSYMMWIHPSHTEVSTDIYYPVLSYHCSKREGFTHDFHPCCSKCLEVMHRLVIYSSPQILSARNIQKDPLYILKQLCKNYTNLRDCASNIPSEFLGISLAVGSSALCLVFLAMHNALSSLPGKRILGGSVGDFLHLPIYSRPIKAPELGNTLYLRTTLWFFC